MTNNTTIDRPIEGEISQRSGGNRTPQQDGQAFLAALDLILAQDGVRSLHWTQYTPYFNDGDPCEFGTGELFVRLEDRFIPEHERIEDEDDWAAEYIENRPGIATSYTLQAMNYNAPGRPEHTWQNPDPNYSEKYASWLESNSKFELNGQPTRHIFDAMQAIEWAAFENVLQDNFGDPATVTATKDGFSVEYYEHD